jgi:phosphate starvation-inducible PhoH-like protein
MKKEKDNSESKLYHLYSPKSDNQKDYVNALNKKDDCITIVTGPAGTGKTLMACNAAVNYLKDSKIDKIIITRPVVSVEEDIGFLPGTIAKKMDPWTRPIFDIFEEYYSRTQVTNMVLNGQIEISPLGFMRGRTFKNAFIIADEMQNSSPNQMYMLLTRIGTNSRMVITGDLEQSDKYENNGLKDLLDKYKKSEKLTNILLVELDKTDVQRSELVKDVMKLYEKQEQIPNTNLIPFQPNNSPIKNLNTRKLIMEITQNGENDAALMPRKDLIK